MAAFFRHTARQAASQCSRVCRGHHSTATAQRASGWAEAMSRSAGVVLPRASQLFRRNMNAAQSACLRRLLSPDAVRQFSAAADLPPFVELPMPSLSPTMTQGNIAEWKKAEGEKISAGDVLAEIETDKATMEMESMEDGYLARILMSAGSKDVPVGTPVAIVVEDESAISAFANYTSGSAPAAAAPAESTPAPVAAPTASAPTPAPKMAARSPGDRIFASPLAKKLAREYGLELSGISGTGPEGRIIKADVEEAKVKAASAPPAAAAGEEFPSWMFPDYTDMPIKQIQKITAQRLTESKQTVPHYYLTVDVQMDKLMAARKQLNAALESQKKAKLSVTDFIIKASSLALMKVPAMNSSWVGDKIRTYHAADISIAVQTEHGLMVPIVKDADTKGLATISAEVKALAGKARENKLTPAEFMGGTFTISNLGMFGVKQFCAIVNPPQAAILAVGGSEVRVIPGKVEGTYEEALFMCATISCDHRVVDGAVAAQWLASFKGNMEDPMSMLL